MPAIMDSSSLSHDGDEHDLHINKAHYLELEYEESIRKTDCIIKDEETRRLRLKILLLEDENNNLHNQLAFEDDRVDGLECEIVDLQKKLEETDAESHRYQGEIWSQARELNNMKVELKSLNDVSVDSTKLLTEKLSLARELAVLKPELDHLRNQVTLQQNALSDKLALQRQVDTLQVELQNSKASKRAALKESSSEKDDALRKQLDDLRKELTREKRELEKSRNATEKDDLVQKHLDDLRKEVAREKKEMEKSRKAAEKDVADWETRKELLEGKLEAMRAKLRSTKEQLKETQEELARTLAAPKASIIIDAEGSARNPRKRSAKQISVDATIGTPDGVAIRGKRNGAKRGRQDQTILGEKSTFSITPFLNRTISIAPETSSNGLEADETDAGVQAILETIAESPSIPENQSPSKKADSILPTVKAKKSASAPKKSGNDSTTKPIKVQPPKSRGLVVLEEVAEEEGEDIANPQPAVGPVSKGIRKPLLQVPAPNIDESEPKKKKRKLGANKTIFDEEDGETTKRPAKINLGPVRALGRLGAKKRLQVGLAALGDAEFSPLKKDRRGGQASFLA